MDADRPMDLLSSKAQLLFQSRETHTHTSQWDTRLRETTTGRDMSMISHPTSQDQSEDITGPLTTSITPGTESSMLTEERDTPSSTSARERDAQTARTVTLITLPARDTTEKI